MVAHVPLRELRVWVMRSRPACAIDIDPRFILLA